MPKLKECKVKGFEGHVIFHDPLNSEQVFAIEEAQDNAADAEKVKPSKFLTQVYKTKAIVEASEKGEAPQLDENFVARWSSKTDHLFLPAILLCVKEWHLEGIPEDVTIDTFPMSPRSRASALVDWLWTQITMIYQGEIEVPNE
jgi:hypothetical protein